MGRRKQESISDTRYVCPECFCDNVCQIRSGLYECDKCRGLFEKDELFVKRYSFHVNTGHILPGGMKANGCKIPRKRREYGKNREK